MLATCSLVVLASMGQICIGSMEFSCIGQHEMSMLAAWSVVELDTKSRKQHPIIINSIHSESPSTPV